jgi:hypothetical protein
MEERTYLLAACSGRIASVELTLQSINVENALACTGAPAPASEQLLPGNRVLNYLHSCCLRFPLDNSIRVALAKQARLAGRPLGCRIVKLVMLNGASSHRHTKTLVIFMLCMIFNAIALPRSSLPPHTSSHARSTMHAGDDQVAQSMAGYAQELLRHALNDMAHKPHGTTLALAPAAATSAAEAVRQATQAEGPSARDLGTWVRDAMCIVPLQLSRCSGSTLEPMHDGEPRRDFEEHDDIISMSKRLQLGLYESVLSGHSGPVKVHAPLLGTSAAACTVRTFCVCLPAANVATRRVHCRWCARWGSSLWASRTT